MIVCLDTNVLIQARANHHPYGVLLDSISFSQIRWAVSNRVLTEYREITEQRAGKAAWATLNRFIELVDASGDLIKVSPHYQFRVISHDPDDNAFTDCAIAAGADFVITSDRDFAPLANAGYKPQPIAPEAFIERYRGVYV